jgi:hypothetical protein
MNRLHAIVLAAALCLTSGADAQVPSWYFPRNRVVPTVSFGVSLDPATSNFRYSYALANGAAAEQRIASFRVQAHTYLATVLSPPNWTAGYLPGPSIFDDLIMWGAWGPVDPAWVELHPGDIPSFLSEIAPGTALAGFVLLSPCAIVAPLRYYILGYNHLAETPDEEGVLPAPPWRDDSVQGTMPGPGDCSVVADWGSGTPATEGFIGLVNFASGAVLPAGAVTIQLKLSRSGEVVHPQTLSIKLNGVTVTPSFVVNSLGDRVAVFQPGAPLKSGRNTLEVSINGIKPGTNQTGTDSDKFTFDRP